MFNPKFVDMTAKLEYYRALAQYFYVVGMARAEGFDAMEYMTKEMVDAHARWSFEGEPWPEVPCADMEEAK